MAQTNWEKKDGEWVKTLTDGSTIHATEDTVSNGDRNKNHVHNYNTPGYDGENKGYSTKDNGTNNGGSDEAIGYGITTFLGLFGIK